ncbi:hypothetical protein ACS3UN_06955 [Oscillospiraceae bacterium LTW-04]|nr:hypothetical protein RBH76_03405 [Oscillospiraceae bacterium MB24-C1]
MSEHDTRCPVCGKTPEQQRSWVRCPKHQAPVCMTHCYSGCPHLDQSSSRTVCNFNQSKEARQFAEPTHRDAPPASKRIKR